MPVDSSLYFAVRRFGLGATWPGTAITVPIECTRITLEQEDTSNAAALRSDPTDPSTQKGIPPGQELEIVGSKGAFQPGSTIGYAAAVAGGGPLVVSYIL